MKVTMLFYYKLFFFYIININQIRFSNFILSFILVILTKKAFIKFLIFKNEFFVFYLIVINSGIIIIKCTNNSN